MQRENDLEIKNAKIESTFLGIEDHGAFTCSLGLDYGRSGQGFGMYGLGDDAIPIKKILDVVGVSSWEKLKGQIVRVEADLYHVARIGNVLKDKWFSFDEYFEKKVTIKK